MGDYEDGYSDDFEDDSVILEDAPASIQATPTPSPAGNKGVSKDSKVSQAGSNHKKPWKGKG